MALGCRVRQSLGTQRQQALAGCAAREGPIAHRHERASGQRHESALDGPLVSDHEPVSGILWQRGRRLIHPRVPESPAGGDDDCLVGLPRARHLLLHRARRSERRDRDHSAGDCGLWLLLVQPVRRPGRRAYGDLRQVLLGVDLRHEPQRARRGGRPRSARS